MFRRIKSFLLEHKSTRQTVAKNILWLFSGETASRLLKIIVVVYAARILGAEGWGVFSYAITLAGFFIIFSDIGLGALLTREVVQNLKTKERYISTTFFIKLVVLAFSTLLIIFIAPHFTKIEAAQSLLPIVALLLIFDSLREFGFSLNRAFEKMEREAVIKTFTNLAIVSLGIGALIISPSPRSLAIGYLLGSIIGFLATAWILKNYFRNLFVNFSKKLVRPIFSAAWPFALSGVLGGIMISTDVLLLGWFKSASEVGFYSAAQRPAQFLYVVPGILATAVFPVFARLVKKSESKKVREILEKTISFTLLLGIPLTLGGIILGKELMTLLFGNEYLPSVLVFQILLPTILAVFPATLIGNVIFAYNKQRVFVKLMGIGAIGNIALNIILIPLYGIVGAALATLFAQTITSILVWQKMKQINYFSVLPHLKRVAVAALLMTIATVLLRQLGVYFIVNIIISMIIYYLLLTVFKEPLIKEVKAVLQS